MKTIRCMLSNATRCENFKSGVCMSSVNCKYQTELIAVPLPEAVFMPTKEAWEKMQAENSRLTAENAELRARLDKAVELPRVECIMTREWLIKKLQEKTVYTVIKNCTNCHHYNAGWAECRAPATANFDCESTRRTCFMQDIIEDECKKHLFVAEMKFDLVLLDPKTGKPLPYYFTDREAAEARLRELKERNND